jgi:hypothetical protein
LLVLVLLLISFMQACNVCMQECIWLEIWQANGDKRFVVPADKR